jgi:hypothetical protein
MRHREKCRMAGMISRKTRRLKPALYKIRLMAFRSNVASRLPGEPAEGVEDIHFHPAVPRTARLSLIVAF